MSNLFRDAPAANPPHSPTVLLRPVSCACRAAYDELLVAPTGDDASAPTGTVVRAAAEYTPRDDRFLLKTRDYDRQYSQLYFYRLQQMQAPVEAAAQRAWPGISGVAAGPAPALPCLLVSHPKQHPPQHWMCDPFLLACPLFSTSICRSGAHPGSA